MKIITAGHKPITTMTLSRCSNNTMAILINGRVGGMVAATQDIDSSFIAALNSSLICKLGEEDMKNHELERYLEDDGQFNGL